MNVERELFVKALWVQIDVARHAGALPLVGKLARRNRQPAQRHRIVGDVGAVQSYSLAIEIIGEGFIGGRRIAQRTSRQCHCSVEILVQLAIKTEASAHSGTVAVRHSALHKTLPANPDVPRPAKPA